MFINGDLVNLRVQPSLSSEIFKRLAKNSEVIEISRYEDWVEVTTNNKSLDYGWVHQSLLTTAEGKPIASPGNQQFEKFQMHFNSLVDQFESDFGINPFSGMDQLDEGSLQVKASPDWFNLSTGQRDAIITEVFDLWGKYVETGKSVLVEIVDEKRDQLMIMFK